MDNIEAEKLGEEIAKKAIETAEQLLIGFAFSDEDQIKFWLGFNREIQHVD